MLAPKLLLLIITDLRIGYLQSAKINNIYKKSLEAFKYKKNRMLVKLLAYCQSIARKTIKRLGAAAIFYILED